MKKLLKPACLGFYVLMLLSSFMVGIYYADLIEAGKNQGLAAGAIVLGYGVLFGGIGFVASFFLAYFMKIRTIKMFNWILLVGVITTFGYLFYRFQERNQENGAQEEQHQPTPVPTEAAPTSAIYQIGLKPRKHKYESNTIQQYMGMGFFEPNLFGVEALYFYGDPNLEKSILEHAPTDSISFKEGPAGAPQIATAPPYFVPAHMKMDYSILSFRIVSITAEFVEIWVNDLDGRTAYVDKRAGKILLWPDFLLKVNSVEFAEGVKQRIFTRHFDKSAIVSTKFDFLKPIRIRDDWMEVMLMNDNFERLGKGWIRWRKDGQLLITYNLLS